jgi:hypothetical protein
VLIDSLIIRIEKEDSHQVSNNDTMIASGFSNIPKPIISASREPEKDMSGRGRHHTNIWREREKKTAGKRNERRQK